MQITHGLATEKKTSRTKKITHGLLPTKKCHQLSSIKGFFFFEVKMRSNQDELYIVIFLWKKKL